MRRFALALAFSLALAASPEGGAAERNDAEVKARASALQVAGAFSNDGFKIRDSHWFEPVAPKAAKIIQVNLYAGNQYWFIAALDGGGEGADKEANKEGAKDQAAKLVVSLYNEEGKPVVVEPYENGSQAAAGFAPAASGPYYVKIEETQGGPATVCLLYCYK